MPTRSTSTHHDRLSHERGDLEANLAALRRQLAGLIDEGRETAETDFSEEGGDPDGGVVERDRLRTRITDTEERLRQLDRAETALAEGTYGTCRVCGEQIPEERLVALPTTTLCVSCKAAGHPP